MLFDWLGGLLDGGADSSRPSLRRKPLGLEKLEDRAVPAAIRPLPGFTANTLPGNDDGSTPGPVPVGFTMNFFGNVDTEVFVNNNGNVTFDQALSAFTPTDLNSDNGGIPIIAAFFADVDTRGTGDLVQYGTDVLCGRNVFGVNWTGALGVNYYDATAGGHIDLFNKFQLILVDRSDTGAGNFDIEFNYDQIMWETGDASGGTNGLGGESARVGYSNGTGNAGTFFELPGSGVNGAFLDGGPNALINQTLLSSTPGRLHFLVRNGMVIQALQATGNLDVTSGSRILAPYRYITDTVNCVQRGQLTLVNVNPVTQNLGAAVDVCLDITAGGMAALDTVFPPPITVVFTNLPPDVQIVNVTGTTATGRPFIQVNEPMLRDVPLRIDFIIRNFDFDAPTTYFRPQALGVRVFAGPFDPNLA